MQTQKSLKHATDRYDRIIPNLCNNFIKKYEANPELYNFEFAQDLRAIGDQLDVYIQRNFLRHTDIYEVLHKYQIVGQVQLLVRSVIQGQVGIVGFLGNLVYQGIKDKANFISKIEMMTNKAYQRCQNCSMPFQKAQIESVQAQIGLRFRDAYSYFSHDVDQINKLSEQASVLVRKKSLNIEGIAEEQYIIKLQKIHENVNTTIQYISNSLNNITKFQQKFGEIQQYQYNLQKDDESKLYETKNKFNSKRYLLDLTKHFHKKISDLEEKLSKIKTYFVHLTNTETQTQSQFNECSVQNLELLKKTIIDLQNEKRQILNSNIYLDKQLKEQKLKVKNLQDSQLCLKNQKQKLQMEVKNLQVQIEKLQISYQKSTKKIQQALNEQLRINEKNNLEEKMPEEVSKQNQRKEKFQIQGLHQEDFANIAIKKMLRGYTNSKSRKNIELLEQKEGKRKRSSRKQVTPKVKTENSGPSKDRNSATRQTKDLSKTIEYLKKQNEEEKKGKLIRKSENISPKKSSFIRKTSKIGIEQITKVKKDSIFKKQKQASKNIVQEDEQHQQPKAREEESEDFNEIDYYKQIYHNLNNYNLNIKPYVSEGRFVQEISSFIHQIISNGSKNYNLATNFGKRFSLNRGSFLFGKSGSKKFASLSKFGEQSDLEKKGLKKSKMSQLRMVNEIDDEFKKLIKKKLQERQRNESSQESQDSTDQKQEEQEQKTVVIKSLQNVQQQKRKQRSPLKPSQFWPSQSVSQNRPFIEALPLLKNSIRNSLDDGYQNPIDLSKFIQELQFPITQLDFVEKDIRIIFLSIKNAYQYGKNMMKEKGNSKKHKRNETWGEGLLVSIQMCFIKQVVNRLAHLHLINKGYYEKIKQFLICPYESFVTHMAEPSLTKSSSTSTLRQCIKDILYMHRKCTVRGDICKHLRYLLVKIVSFEKDMLITNNTKIAFDKQNGVDSAQMISFL